MGDVVLKPCPFCGGEAERRVDKPDGLAFVACTDDECWGSRHLSACCYPDEHDDGITAGQWNTRHESTELALLRNVAEAARAEIATFMLDVNTCGAVLEDETVAVIDALAKLDDGTP